MSSIFDHADIYSIGYREAFNGGERDPKADNYQFDDDESKEEYKRSWLQGFDGFKTTPPWEEVATGEVLPSGEIVLDIGSSGVAFAMAGGDRDFSGDPPEGE